MGGGDFVGVKRLVQKKIKILKIGVSENCTKSKKADSEEIRKNYLSKYSVTKS